MLKEFKTPRQFNLENHDMCISSHISFAKAINHILNKYINICAFSTAKFRVRILVLIVGGGEERGEEWEVKKKTQMSIIKVIFMEEKIVEDWLKTYC